MQEPLPTSISLYVATKEKRPELLYRTRVKPLDDLNAEELTSLLYKQLMLGR